MDFVSDDRTRASADGTTFMQQRWSTPLAGHRDIDGRRVLTSGEGVWHAPQPEGAFTYLEFYSRLHRRQRRRAATTSTTPLSAPAGSGAGYRTSHG